MKCVLAIVLLFLLSAHAEAKNCLNIDPVPTPAATYGLTCETFSINNFTTDNVDTGNVGSCVSTAGCFYTQMYFPNTTCGLTPCLPPPGCGNCLWNFVTNPHPTPATDYSISGGKLTLSQVSGIPYHGNDAMMMTCHDDGNGGIYGYTFGPTFYTEYVASTPGGSGFPGNDAIIWAVDTRFLVAGAGNTADFYEWDIPEVGSVRGFHWNTNGTTTAQISAVAGGDIAFGTDPIGTSLLSAAQITNAGTPTSNGYLNGWQNRANAGGQPVGLGSDTTIAFSAHNCLIINGPVAPGSLVISSIHIWEPPDPPSSSGPGRMMLR